MVSAPRLTPLFRARSTMRPLCPGEGRGIGLSWLRSSQISSSNRAGPRCGRFPWNLNHQGFAFDRWIQCWVRKSGCVCPINPAMTGRKPSPTTMPPFFGWLRKAVFYQRTAGSSSAKESQEAPRESMCSTNIHARTQIQLTNSGRAQITYLEKHRLFNQMLGSRSPINNFNEKI